MAYDHMGTSELRKAREFLKCNAIDFAQRHDDNPESRIARIKRKIESIDIELRSRENER